VFSGFSWPEFSPKIEKFRKPDYSRMTGLVFDKVYYVKFYQVFAKITGRIKPPCVMGAAVLFPVSSIRASPCCGAARMNIDGFPNLTHHRRR
jgi:hypothetical protein